MYTNNNFLKKTGWTRLLAVNKSVNRPSKASQFYHVTIFFAINTKLAAAVSFQKCTMNKIGF